ncbi:MAG: malic enzyme-like NAD(P)-binding protein [Patescibacteria group bacterium]
MDHNQKALELHRQLKGKIALASKVRIESRDDLSWAYTPGVAAPCLEIAKDPAKVWEYTSRRNWVAVISDGSAVLGLGNIGPLAGLPVMEGKAVLFKEFADIDAFPIILDTQNVDEIVATVKHIALSFGGINLEDISAPRCFEIEERLKAELDIPLWHDDQHGTAIVVLAGLINALKLTNRAFDTAKIVISGAGAAGVAIAKILLSQGAKQIVVVDSQGVISSARTDLNESKKRLLDLVGSYPDKDGQVVVSLADALVGADVFIGVSAPGIVSAEMIKSMAADPIVFAMANPTPEIMPDAAKAAGAKIVATGRSDYPNQINNVLAFPGVFRGALDGQAKKITEEMKLAAAHALADYVTEPSVDNIIPPALDKHVAYVVAKAVQAVV